MYTRADCKFCDKAKELLAPFIVATFDIAHDNNKAILVEKGLKTVPQIWFNPVRSESEYIGGFDRLKTWLEKNKDKLQ